MSKPDMMFGGFGSKAEMDRVAEALLETIGADTCITPGMVSGKDHLFVTFGRTKPTEGGVRGFVLGVLWGLRKGLTPVTLSTVPGPEVKTDDESTG